MAKAGYPLGQEVYMRRDPLTGEQKSFTRNDHSRQSSQRLKSFQKCMRRTLEGQTYSGSTTQERVRAQRAAFTRAAESCRGAR